MKRKGIVVLVLVMMTAGLAFASGDKEEEREQDFRPGYGYGPRGMMPHFEEFPCYAEDFEPEEVSLTGTVSFSAVGTTLTADGAEWLLMYPRRALADVEIAAGDTVTVKGIKTPGYRFQDDDEAEEGNFLMVTSAEIGGETYELLDRRGGFPGGMRGGFHPMHGGRGGRRW